MRTLFLEGMNIVRFFEAVTVSFKKSAGSTTTIFEAQRDYVISRSQLDRITQDENVRNRLFKVSSLEHRLRPFDPMLKKKEGTNRLLFYNGSGGYGDQIVSWPVAKWLSDQGFEVHIMADPGNQCCWYNFPWVKTIQSMPLAYEQFKMFDWHFLMEYVNNTDEHLDQLHPVDTMFVRMGVDPRSIPPEKKVVEPIYTWAEQQSVKMVFTDKRFLGIYQLSSANPIRALTPNDSAFLLYRLAQATPDIHWLAIFDEFIPKAYPEALKCRECGGSGKIVAPVGPAQVQPTYDEHGTITGWTGTATPSMCANPEMGPALALAAVAEAQKEPAPECAECRGTGLLAPNVQPYTSSHLRDLWALTRFRASIVVAPDSMMIHAAGCQGVPCVGLWGPVGPANRAGYYRNHFPIFHREACQFAPCFAYLATFPRYCPPRGTARLMCEVTAAVTPAEVIDAVKKIRR